MARKTETLTAPRSKVAKSKSSHQIELNQDPVAVELWAKCLDIIRDNLSNQVFKTWFDPIKALSWKDSQLTIQVPSHFFYEWLEEHYYSLMQTTVFKILGDSARLQYEVVVDDSHSSLEDRTIHLPAFRRQGGSNQSSLPFSTASQPSVPNTLNNRYNFDTFIRGESNQLAVSAGYAISDAPGKTKFNPLMVYGGTGLGKTHLVQAIGNAALKNDPSTRVFYTNSERFTMDYITAIQNNKIQEFTNFFRSVDVLIVDDIQFFGGKEKTQDNFFHTFNALHQSGKQLILTADKPPKELQDLDERLISRFSWGLSVDIQPPDFEMRMALLQRKSADEGIELPTELVEYIARHITGSVRELEGCLISLIAKVSFDKRELTIELAKEAVRSVTGGAGLLRQLSVEEIKGEVSAYYNLSVDLLSAKTRKHEVVLARQMAMYLTKQLTTMSLKTIGSHFGGRDHTTVLHSCQMISDYLDVDQTVKIAVASLRKKFARD